MTGLGIDIGTTSICVVLYDNQKKKIIKSISAENQFLEGGDGIQNPDKIVETVFSLLKEFQNLEWEAVGISSQMHGILYIDGKGSAVSDFYTWKHNSGKQYESYLQNKTGCSIYTGYGSVTHFYLKEKGMISKETVCFLGIGDYVALKLTQNAEGVTEESMAASFGLYDLKKHCFDKSIINAAGIDFSYYPQTTVGKKVIGYYMKKPVFASIGDHQASFFGAVGDLEQSISLNVGTGSQVSVFHPEYVLYEQTEVRPFLGKGYLYVGASLNGGKVYERMAVFFEQVCEAFAGKKIDVYSKMYEIAKTKPDTSLRAVSNLYGQRGGKEKESGFFGLTSDNFYPADVIRSFVNSMGLELWGLYQKFPENIRENRIKITASGNGIRKNKLLIEEIEKIFDLPVVFSELKEEAAAGAADFALWRLRTQ